MSAGWIEGRFEGVYSGPRRPSVDSKAKRGKPRRTHRSSETRRFGFEIQSGRVHDLSDCHELDPEALDDGPVIRQERLKRVRLAEPGGQDADRETSLFDVHISDWQLKHPAESGGRAYGTIIGTIRARRRPFAEEPPLTKQPFPPPQTKHPTTRKLESVHPDAEPLRNETSASDDAAIVAPKLGWAEAALLVGIVFAAIGYSCGFRHAAIWVAPIAAASVLLWLKPDGAVRGTPVWMKRAPTALQLVVLASPLAVAWKSSCWPMLGNVQLMLLAVPVILSVFLGSRSSLWLTCFVWTAVACSQCAGTNAASCLPIATVDARSASEAQQPPDRAGRRTDERGRWPVMPPTPAHGLAQRPDAAPENLRFESPGFEFSPNASLASSPPMPSSTPIPTPMPAEAAATPPQASPASTMSPSSAKADVMRRDHRLTQVDGGWLSPDHRRAPREHVLISIEQANRTPALFFESGGAHRVYLPTDPVFEDGSSTLRRDAPVVLARVAALLSLPAQPPVVLEIHSDSAGAPENQLALTRRRAERIRGWLIERGHVSASRFEMRAIGGARPLVPPDGDYGAQQPNRRIEIRIADKN